MVTRFDYVNGVALVGTYVKGAFKVLAKYPLSVFIPDYNPVSEAA